MFYQIIDLISNPSYTRITELCQLMTWHQTIDHATMGIVSEEDEKVAAIKEALRTKARADVRADATKERTRQELRETILEAARLGLGPAEITKLIGHRYSEGHVSRMILGKA